MKYCIGEFASILGVTSDTLRLYEKHDIVRPIKDNSNNYRYFDDLDARDLLMSRWYRSMQIPLQDVALLIKDASSEHIIEKFQETQLNLEAEIKRSTMLLNKIIEINNEFKQIERSLNICTLKEVPGIYRLRQTHKNDLLINDYLKDTVNEWMNMLPFSFYSFRIENSDILSEANTCCDYNWGLSLLEDEVHKLNVEIDENVEYISPTTCISAVIACSGEESIRRDSLQFMLDYLEEHQYSIAGDIVGKIILTEKIEGESRTYLEVNIPI
ncbi:MerR family transcriptional regulator [Paenibacillus sp. 19GGS1-52]|uniref:MerR family transcriptional regulator n=1 Tax=Paenibacillus sp. 19GGS1-52 TaxID=2758563 RepID=UPI001EFB55C3|nr:MerR family transcriptional regulator [Paenibacillus sp. 19GGS1-52]ULO05822.1 MerR family transcriptional regulator [Paenibacillus sp. 19GGS1-52]